MKKIHWLLLFLFLSLSLSGQRNSDYGVFAGVSSYFGDINPTRPLYSPLPAGGFFYRYNLNPREALRANLFIGGLRGNLQHNLSSIFYAIQRKASDGILLPISLQEWELRLLILYLPPLYL
jgi:hypothetical protein